MKPKNTKKPAPKPLKRKLHFNEGEVWTYRISGHAVVIQTPDLLQRFVAYFPAITGDSWDAIERDQWKGNWKGIHPQQIKNHIEEHLRPSFVAALAV